MSEVSRAIQNGNDTEIWRTFYTYDAQNRVSKAFSVCYNENTKVSTYYDTCPISKADDLSENNIGIPNETNDVFKVDRYGRVIVTNENKVNNLSKELDNIMKNRIASVDGYDFRTPDELTYPQIVCKNKNRVDNVRLPHKIEKDYFNNLKNSSDPLIKVLTDFNLKLTDSEPNFAIIPINVNGHITTLIVDLSNNN